MRPRDKSSDHHGKSVRATGKAAGDKAKRVSDTRRSRGPAAQKSSVANRPRGKPIAIQGGQRAYHNRSSSRG